MNDAYTTTLERLRRNSTAQKEALATRLDTAAQQQATARGTLPAGTRVFDTVWGTEGVVEVPGQQTRDLTTLVFVRLDGGGLVARPMEKLIVRPTPPGA